MCGIFALLNYFNYEHQTIHDEFTKGKNRGPEFSKLDFSYMKMVLGFHRLAINGLDQESNQPIVIDDVVLICNGEIYNYKQLYNFMGVTPKTNSDCEVIIHLYIKYGIEQTLKMLDGVFSFVLYDNRLTNDLNNRLYIARDPMGIRPLYCLYNNNNEKPFNLLGFASEMKCLIYFSKHNANKYRIRHFTPGTYSVFNLSDKVQCIWEPIVVNKHYYIPTFSYSLLVNSKEDVFNEIYSNINYYLSSAVYKRCMTTERPIACLLSGGLDSSLITALVNNYYKINNKETKLETYSIGLVGSEDLKNARFVADYLGTNHTEIIVTEKEMFDTIPELIYTIESYDTTTIRASIGNYLLGKYISENSKAKVIFNGDGSDELCGGYLYMSKCPDDIEYDKETRRLLEEIHLFDVLRSDKCISSHGLEPRTPFLDRTFVNYYLSIPPYFRNNKNHMKCEKFLLRNSFSLENFANYNQKQILPDEILWRKKEAFSDGVSSSGRSLYKILQEHIEQLLLKDNEYNIHNIGANIDTEKNYYYQIFNSHYPHCSDIIPHYWMPKYIDATDPSARTLEIYNKEVTCF
jgi:asparagine synthase (glutamine-hydrolysing)